MEDGDINYSFAQNKILSVIYQNPVKLCAELEGTRGHPIGSRQAVESLSLTLNLLLWQASAGTGSPIKRPLSME